MTWRVVPRPIYGLVAVSNHWRFVVRWGAEDRVKGFFRRLTVIPRVGWHAHLYAGGTGPYARAVSGPFWSKRTSASGARCRASVAGLPLATNTAGVFTGYGARRGTRP
jgi:hypothetical protein